MVWFLGLCRARSLTPCVSLSTQEVQCFYERRHVVLVCRLPITSLLDTEEGPLAASLGSKASLPKATWLFICLLSTSSYWTTWKDNCQQRKYFPCLVLNVVWGCWHHWDVIPSEGLWLEEAGIVEKNSLWDVVFFERHSDTWCLWKKV